MKLVKSLTYFFIETCDPENTECKFDTLCEIQDGHYFCTCPNGLAGDKCEHVIDCEDGKKYHNCTRAGGICKFSVDKAVCDCGKDKKFDTSLGICRGMEIQLLILKFVK